MSSVSLQVILDDVGDIWHVGDITTIARAQKRNATVTPNKRGQVHCDDWRDIPNLLQPCYAPVDGYDVYSDEYAALWYEDEDTYPRNLHCNRRFYLDTSKFVSYAIDKEVVLTWQQIRNAIRDRETGSTVTDKVLGL